MMRTPDLMPGPRMDVGSSARYMDEREKKSYAKKKS